ncbi:hypothetical protein [Candidatus Hadarchaeum sp.]|uniref:hypothetical protein n=1 Tax=Candidatus Hadarchaeum sp. TaxID=2883567 RepID=UPI00319DEC97
MVIVATSLITLSEGRRKSAEAIEIHLEAKMIGDRLAAAMNSVYVNGPNISLSLKLPENIGPYPYRVFSDNSVGLLTVESSVEVVEINTVCKNFKNFVLERENLTKKIQIFWEGSQLCIAGR